MQKGIFKTLAYVGYSTMLFVFSWVSFASAQIAIDECSDITGMGDLTTGYILTQDLDCTAEGINVMIGSAVSPFEGTFDGSGYTITVDIDAIDSLV